MSPIRPERLALYPPDWQEISRAIREDRAGGRCECVGECRSPRHPGAREDGNRCAARHGQPNPRTGSKVVLTTAHLNHDETDCRPENLRSMCQLCHLTYDAQHHAETRARARTAQAAAQCEPLLDLETR